MSTAFPFELERSILSQRLDEMVDATFAALQSEFLLLPRGPHYISYPDFQGAYEVLKRHTGGFAEMTLGSAWAALCEDSLSFVVLRTILGVSPPEWADLARERCRVDVPLGVARGMDVKARKTSPRSGLRDLFASMRSAQSGYVRSRALVEAAVMSIAEGAGEAGNVEFLHRLAKMDTEHGLESLRHVAAQHVPYAVLLYERYLGRPFASHRDSVSERVGNVMEDAIEDILATANISFRKTGRAERIPGFEQAPDFFIPDEVSPRVLIEAKITGDDGTARDKVARILRLASMRDERVRAGRQGFELVVCIDGRGFGARRQDMRDMLTATQGKVFTLSTLDRLVAHTSISAFRP